MLSFKDFLTEARMAPLYHGTAVEYLENILFKRQGIFPRTEHSDTDLLREPRQGRVKGVSTSRSLHFSGWYKASVVLELDQQLLTRKYKIIPIQYFQGGALPARGRGELFRKVTPHNEQEEFIVTDKPIPVKYITRLWIPSRYLLKEGMPTVVKKIEQEFGSSFIRVF